MQKDFQENLESCNYLCKNKSSSSYNNMMGDHYYGFDIEGIKNFCSSSPFYPHHHHVEFQETIESTNNTPEARAKIHKEAERRRRERINFHLHSLRTLKLKEEEEKGLIFIFIASEPYFPAILRQIKLHY